MTPSATPQDSATPRISSVAWKTVAIFFLIYVVSYIDRQMLIYLVGPIRESLHITDFEFSLIQGLTFALFFSVLGIPIGWLVDHAPRRRIISCGIAIWSLGTIGCGLAQRYWQLLLGRIGLAAGEATVAPTAYSMISDLFPPHRLTLALSIVGIGAQVGSLLAAAIAGYIVISTPQAGLDLGMLGHLQGWQVALLLVGFFTLLLVPLIYAVPEPERRGHKKGQDASKGELLALLKANPRFYICHFVGFGFASMVGWAVTAWVPTFFMRHHGWDIQHAAMATGTIHLAGLPGTLLMGYVVDRWFAAGRRDAHLQFYAATVVTMGLFLGAAMLVESANLALLLLIPFNALVNFQGIGAASLQIVTPDRLRGRVSSIYLLVYTLLGMGIGPILVAFMTDYVFRDDALIGYAILSGVTGSALISATFLLMAAPRMRVLVSATLGRQ